MRKLKSEKGQALVETALTMILYTVILVGAAEFGQFAFAAIEVSDAAKAAAQYASQSRSTATDLATMLTLAQNEYYSPSSLKLVSPTATSGYACTCADGTAPPDTKCGSADNSISACPNSYLVATVTVQTQATFNAPIHLPGLSSSFTLNATAVQKVLQ